MGSQKKPFNLSAHRESETDLSLEEETPLIRGGTVLVLHVEQEMYLGLLRLGVLQPDQNVWISVQVDVTHARGQSRVGIRGIPIVNLNRKKSFKFRS